MAEIDNPRPMRPLLIRILPVLILALAASGCVHVVPPPEGLKLKTSVGLGDLQGIYANEASGPREKSQIFDFESLFALLCPEYRDPKTAPVRGEKVRLRVRGNDLLVQSLDADDQVLDQVLLVQGNHFKKSGNGFKLSFLSGYFQALSVMLGYDRNSVFVYLSEDGDLVVHSSGEGAGLLLCIIPVAAFERSTCIYKRLENPPTP
jgi:hypothetical protein